MTDRRSRSARPFIPGVNRGDPITARWLSNAADAINLNTQGLAGPQSISPLSRDPQDYPVDPTDQQQPEGQSGSRIYLERARNTSTVRVYDSGGSGNYVTVERIDAISFNSTAGTLTLYFRNR